MIRLTSKRLTLVSIVGVLSVVTASPGMAVSAQSQDATNEFAATIMAARDVAQAVIDAANLASEEGETARTSEQQLRGPIAENAPLIAVELRDFVGILEAAEVPDARAADVATQVVALESLATAYERIAASAAAFDVDAVNDLYEEIEQLHIDLAAEVSPDYFDIAYLTTFRNRFGSFKGLTDEDRAYLDGVRSAIDEFERRNREAGRKVFDGTAYVSTEAMMQAFYEAGAGEAFPAVEAALQELTPSERFTDEHAWLLLQAVDDARIDRLIGEAARDGDAVEFMTLNMLLELNPEVGEDRRVYPELDPAFGTIVSFALQEGLDPSTPVARSDYGQTLFHILRDWAYRNPTAVAVDSFSFPGTTVEMQLEAIGRNADLLRDEWNAFAETLDGLEPPVAYADDHGRILGFVDEHGSRFVELLDAAEVGETSAVQPALAAMRQSYCATSADLSEDIAPATNVYFDATFDICR